MTADEILQEYQRGRHFYTQGGITVTGGEPLVQIDFVLELFQKAHEQGIHTCLDTSGVTFCSDNMGLLEKFDRLTAVTDLVMLDIKHIDPEKHLEICGQPQDNILSFARYLDSRHIPVWIRHVVVPGLSDREDDLFRLGQFIGTLHNVKALDVLPYHDMGKAKYHQLGLPYALEDTPPLSQAQAALARETILNGIRDQRLKTSGNF